MRHTYPGHGKWTGTENIALLDGHWNQDGSKLIISDIAGQYHIYGLGPADICSRAHYDQCAPPPLLLPVSHHLFNALPVLAPCLLPFRPEPCT